MTGAAGSIAADLEDAGFPSARGGNVSNGFGAGDGGGFAITGGAAGFSSNVVRAAGAGAAAFDAIGCFLSAIR